jgi:tape measure domain-containing protein
VAVSVLDIQVNSQGAVRSLKQVGAASKATEGAVNGLKSAITGLVAAAGVVSTLKFVFAKTSELESQTKSLEVLTGSVQKAKSIIAELQQLGAVTPFTSTELIDAAKRLNAFGVEAEKVVETTRRLADVSGATGAELQGLVTAYGQVQAKGRLQGEELLQFQERGIALQEELRKMYGMTGEEFQKALSKGRISAEAVEVAIKRLTDAGGKYANGAIAQSETLQGKFSTLTDGVEQLARTIGTVLAPALKAILTQAIQTLDAINNVLAAGRGGGITRNLAGARASMSIGATSEGINRIEKGIGQISGQRNKAGIQQNIQALKEYQAVLQKVGPNDPNANRAVQLQGVIFKKINENISAQQQFNATRANSTKPAGVPALLGETGAAKPRKDTAADKAASAAAKLAEQTKAQLDNAYKLNDLAIANYAIQVSANDVEQLKGEFDKTAIERRTRYLELQKNALSPQERELLVNAQLNEVLRDNNKYAKDKKGLLDEQLKPLTDIIEANKMKLVDDRAYERLIAEGINPELAKQYVAIDRAGEAVMKAIKPSIDLAAAAVLEAKARGASADAVAELVKELERLQQLPGQQVGKARGLAEKTDAEDQAAQKLKDQAEQLKALYTDIGMTIKSGVVDAIQGAVDGTKSLGEVAASVLNNIAAKLLDVAINMALFGAMSGTGTGGGLLGGLFKPRALGGPVSAGTPYMVGERGPELFMPSRGGSIIPNNALGGGGTSVVVNVDASGSSVQGDQAQGRQLGVAISAAVQAELVKQKRPGGLLA